MAAFDGALAARSRRSEMNALTGTTDGGEDLGIQDEVDPVLTEDGLDRVGDVGILGREEVWPLLHDGHPASKPAKCLAELHADESAAEDQEMVGQRVQLERRLAGERPGIEQARDGGHPRFRPEIDEQLLAEEPAGRPAVGRAQVDGPWCDEPRLAQDEAITERPVQVAPVEIDHPRHDGAFVGEHASQIGLQSPTWTPNWAARDVRSATLA